MREGKKRIQYDMLILYYFCFSCCAEEVRRLEATLGSVGEEAGKRALDEVEKIRQQHNSTIKNLTEEVSRLEMVGVYSNRKPHLKFQPIAEN